MAEVINPPTYYFDGIQFNPAFYENTITGGGGGTGDLTEAEANALYLQKTVPDTATSLQTFNAGIKTNTITTVTGNLSLPASTTTAPADLNDNSTRVPTTAWIVSQGFIKSLTGYATYAGTTAFTAIQTFNLGIKSNIINTLTATANMTIGSNLTTGGTVTIGSQQSNVNIKNDPATGGTVNIMNGSLTGGNINIGKYTSVPYPTWTNTTIEGDVNIGNVGRDINIYGNILGTLKTDSIAPTTTNGEIILGSTTGTMILNGEVTATTQLVGTTGNLVATCDFVLENGGGGFNPNTTQITPTYTPASDLTKLGGFAVFESSAGTASYLPVVLCPTTNVPNGYYMVSVTIQSKCTGNMTFSRPEMYLYSSTSQQTSYGAQSYIAGDASTYGMKYPNTNVYLNGLSDQVVTLTQTGNVWVGGTVNGTPIGNSFIFSLSVIKYTLGRFNFLLCSNFIIFYFLIVLI